MKDDRLKEMAKTRVEFRDHIVIYIIVNAFLTVINVWTSPGFLWVLFPIVFWGIGVFFHWREAYHGSQQTRIEREYRKIREETKRK